MLNRRNGAACLLAALTSAAFAQEPADRYYDAIRRNDLPALRALIKSGSIDARDKRGGTPLMYAAAYGSMDAVRALLAAGASVDAVNDFGATALMWGITEPEKVRALVAAGANIRARSRMGRTALFLAAANDGSSATVKMLLDRGASVDERDNQQSTPLQAAAAANDLASIRLLLERGADPNAADIYGMTPMMLAAGNNNVKAIELLLARGAKVNAVTKPEINPSVKNGPLGLGNFTALIAAAPAAGPETIRVLLDAGAAVDATDVRGMTPLMLAIATDHADPRAVRLLLDRGADRFRKDNGGESALDWAVKYNAPAIVRELGLARAQVQTTRVVIPASLMERLDSRAAVARSVDLLERTSATFFKEGGCGSCHAQNMTALAVSAAAAAGLPVHADARAAELKGAQFFLGSLEQGLLQRMDAPVPEILTFTALQLAAGNSPADRATDAMVHNLAALQRQAGNWHVGWVARPPMSDGDISRTAAAIRILQLYGPAGRKAELQRRIQKAAEWLAAAEPKTTDDLDMQLVGLKWAGASSRAWQNGLRRLAALQREDGGWSQTPNLPTDAYATGQALWTMRELGISASDPAWRRGAQYLLQTQAADGSWHVVSRVAKFQPYFESGFPYAGDQWISSSATAWAVMALSYPGSVHQVARK